ncbi:MAG: hypothetical protein EZS28_025032 [Streblomastix strix]|uniref:Uncharacterized protein n=1 Tax=Streblomastix strix TaxID=222440 RepID=A0A5J4VAH9_9EUKA|nr:MAG: hypothetical protein EZS28_025032 [Streblomastix strix]
MTTCYYSGVIANGGLKGQLGFLNLGTDIQQLDATMAEHKMEIFTAQVTQDDLECVCNDSDGLMIIQQYTSHSSQANDHDSKLPRVATS